MVLQVSFRITHDCVFLEFSSYFGKKPILLYCNNKIDYLIIPEKLSEEKKAIANELFGRFNNFAIKEIGSPSEVTYITTEGPCYDIRQTNAVRMMKKLKVFPIFPIKYQNGFEYYTAFIETQEKMDNFITKMSEQIEIEILSIKNLGDEMIETQTAILNHLIEELTSLQTDTFIQAFDGGYYNIPRTIKTDTIACENGKSRYAVD